jgi:SWI/SNF-related matrix-associated actin-dependent regulator of chromatin subfamily A-like protein 1
MGLGKTLQAIAIASHFREDWPLLVICPSSVRMSWGQEIMKWLDIPAEDIAVILSSSQRLDKLINIISYDLVHRMIAQIEQLEFKLFIVDESHYLKSRSAKRTKAIDALVTLAKRVILLSGTPALSRPEELYPQIRCLQPNLFPSFHPFAIRYCAGHRVS